MRISIGVIIGIVLIFVWYKHDHPEFLTRVGMLPAPAIIQAA